MTTGNLEDYFKKLIFLWRKEKGKEINKFIKNIVAMGKNDFRGAYPWAFKETHGTITTTESSETVELPSDFEGLGGVVEHETLSGRKLRKYSPDMYDELVPYSEGLNEGTPQIYKIYYDDNDGVWKLALYPTPDSAISLYISYHVIGDNIPDKFIGGIIAACGKYFYMPGSLERRAAIDEFEREVARLILVDSPDVEPISKVLDSADDPLNWSFSEYMRVGQG